MWTLESKNGGKIQLTFESFNLQACSNYDSSTFEYLDECSCPDYVEVSYGSYSERFCNYIVPDTLSLTSSGSSMVIKFHSDSLINAPGFHAVWTEV